MLNFKAWCEQFQQKPMVWKAKKKDILTFWQNLPGNMPIQPSKPVPFRHKGATYKYDGIRVTGSNQFINAAISRLKDLTNYEGDTSRLHLIYKQQIDKKTQYPLPNTFVFYAQARERDKDKTKTVEDESI